MSIGDLIAILSIIAVVGLASLYIIVSKKKGKKYIGCPYASSCSGKCHSECVDNINKTEK